MPLSRSKKSLIAAGAVLVSGAAAVAFAPVYLRGYARGVIAREVGNRGSEVSVLGSLGNLEHRQLLAGHRSVA